MAKGVDVTIVDGKARIEFTDKAAKDAALPKLLDAGGPNAVTLDTGGTRRTYIVDEAVAVKAGLVDKRRSGK
jgi:hypothetical protein